MIGRDTWDGFSASCKIVWYAVLMSASMLGTLPVLRFLSNLGKLLLEISSRMRWPDLNSMLVFQTLMWNSYTPSGSIQHGRHPRRQTDYFQCQKSNEEDAAMNNNAIRHPPGSSVEWEHLREWVRGKVQRSLQGVLEDSAPEFLARRSSEQRGPVILMWMTCKP